MRDFSLCLSWQPLSEEWLDFIVSCRHGIAHRHDIVEGHMANDTIYNYVQDFIDGKITRAAFWELARFKYPPHIPLRRHVPLRADCEGVGRLYRSVLHAGRGFRQCRPMPLRCSRLLGHRSRICAAHRGRVRRFRSGSETHGGICLVDERCFVAIQLGLVLPVARLHLRMLSGWRDTCCMISRFSR